MIKRLFFTILLSTLVLLSSCVIDQHSKNGGSSSCSASMGSNIVGEWVEYDAADPYAEDYLTTHFIFRSGGSGYWKLMGDLHNPNAERGRGQFSWTQNGNAITVIESDGNIYQLAIHGNELVRTGGLGVEVYRKK